MARLRYRLLSICGVGFLFGSTALYTSCSSDDSEPNQNQPNDDAGSGGSGGSAGAAGYPVPGPGEQCYDPDSTSVTLTASPRQLVLAPGQARELEIVVEPDFCVPTTLSFQSSDPSVVAAPESKTIDLITPRVRVPVTGGSVGDSTLTVSIAVPGGDDVVLDVPVDVRTADLPACSGMGAGRLDDGVTIKGTGGLSLASIGLQKGATMPNAGSYLWSVSPFDVSIACAADQVPAGFSALGPAVTFSPSARVLKRELPFTIPINPALMPAAAHMRHVTVSYSGPHASTPRIIPIADPRIEKDGSGYKLYFMAPWLGTYQAVVKSDAGTVTRTRHLTYRAVIGISMGGGGAAMHGMRNHERFDVVAPLGGPVDWTWLIGHIERNHIGGFLPNDGSTPPTGTAPLPEAPLPYQHPSTFNQWWYEYPKNGNGGSFPRAEYVQIFRDLALMFGNPNGYNATPGAENLPAGVPLNDKTIVGDHPGRECAVWIDPLDGPDKPKQEELNDNCPKERCAYTLKLNNYYDDEFNPNGTFPVISVCDGSPQDAAKSPYANTWSDMGNDKPLELALAVDYDDDGKRDENEPIIRAGHEPYQDVGTDGLASAQEPGYVAGVNEDPAGDDWNPQYNPGGTEGNYRWDQGEPFSDVGLDGVANTVSSPYDFGEGNQTFDMAPGLKTFLERDSRTVIQQLPEATQPEPLDDSALHRLDLWTDGGTRDLFNFAVDASALAGAWSSRGRIVHYYTGFQFIPNQDINDPVQFNAGNIDWGDVPGGVMLRYGKIDPTQADINSGTGQHVGTADDITRRLQAALYYIGSRWTKAPHTLDEAGALDPDPGLPTYCNVSTNSCDFEFTGSDGRKGPVSVNLPPGYTNVNSTGKRYPVIYLLHGYGQTPEDLKAAIVFLQNWMNSPSDSSATRLPKAIMVYVDGRCRPGTDEAECIRGTFYTDSVRSKGPKMEKWFNELMGDVDARFRTLPAEDVEWLE